MKALEHLQIVPPRRHRPTRAGQLAHHPVDVLGGHLPHRPPQRGQHPLQHPDIVVDRRFGEPARRPRRHERLHAFGLEPLRIPRLDDRRDFARDHPQPPVAHRTPSSNLKISRQHLNSRAYTFNISDTPIGGKASGSSTYPTKRTCARSISLATVAGPQPEDVAFPGAGDPDGDVDRAGW